MFKILHLVWAPYPEHNGTTVRLFSVLSRLSHEIILIIPNYTMNGNILRPNEKIIGNIKVKTAPLSTKGIYGKVPLRYLYVLYKLPRKVIASTMNEKFDIIHAHDSSLFIQVAKILSRKLNKPFVIEFHAARKDYIKNINIPGTSIDIPFSGRIVSTYYEERGIKDALQYCDHVITLTSPLKNWISNFYSIDESNITVVPNGVDTDKFTPIFEEAAKKKKKELNLSNKVVMYSGVLDKINGIDEFIKVIPSILAKKPDVSFLFIGHGSEENNIIILSKKFPQVIFLPVVPYEYMPIYYQMCDIFVIPRPSNVSTETIIPLKLLEAMAMERTVLGSSVGGIAEVIKHGENGYLFNKGDFKNFESSLLELLIFNNNNQIGKNARKTILNNYTWDRSASILRSVYENLI